MTLQVLPIWRDSTGSDTGPTAITCRDLTEATTIGTEWLRTHGTRPGMRVVVTDGVTWRRVGTYRAKRRSGGGG